MTGPLKILRRAEALKFDIMHNFQDDEDRESMRDSINAIIALLGQYT